ncbi:MAG TPA: hypothetical protein PLU10_07150 [Chitinophagaceae bacterium]|nr:hypothetical protein [Chitinophagaceae bacterium]
MKKIILITGGAIVIFLLSIAYQSCRPIRTCHLLSGVTAVLVRNATDTLHSTDSAIWSNLQMAIAPNGENFSCKAENFSLITTAMATKLSVQDVYYDTIKHITITSDMNYDSLHPAGTSLNDVFDIPQTLDSYSYWGWNFFLTKRPDDEVFHTFKVVVEVSGGLPYELYLPTIKILH